MRFFFMKPINPDFLCFGLGILPSLKSGLIRLRMSRNKRYILFLISSPEAPYTEVINRVQIVLSMDSLLGVCIVFRLDQLFSL